MRAIIFNGSLEKEPYSTADIISGYLSNRLQLKGIENTVFNLSEKNIPLLDFSVAQPPASVEEMAAAFTRADIHIWLSPLYHGSIPGAMKNCLDWLEITARNTTPYLTDKTVGMICWADGMQAMQGINTMDAVAKALRAWPVPYSIPITHSQLTDNNKPEEPSEFYKEKFDLLVDILSTRTILNKTSGK